MSDNTVTEVTHTGWFSRIGSAIMGVVFGLLMFFLAFPFLFWNEGRAVDCIKVLDDGAAAVISVQADQVISANNDMLVHLSGLADTQETLSDSVFKVSSNALKLRRDVQIYQWQEETSTRTEEKLGGGERKSLNTNTLNLGMTSLLIQRVLKSPDTKTQMWKRQRNGLATIWLW